MADDFDRPVSYDSTQDYAPPIEQKPPEPRGPCLQRRGTVTKALDHSRAGALCIRQPTRPATQCPAEPGGFKHGCGRTCSPPKRGWWGKRLLGDKG